MWIFYTETHTPCLLQVILRVHIHSVCKRMFTPWMEFRCLKFSHLTPSVPAHSSTEVIFPLITTYLVSVGRVMPWCAREGCLNAQARGVGPGNSLEHTFLKVHMHTVKVTWMIKRMHKDVLQKVRGDLKRGICRRKHLVGESLLLIAPV